MLFILSGNKDKYKVSDGFEIRQDPTTDCGVSGPLPSEKIFYLLENYSKYFDDFNNRNKFLSAKLLMQGSRYHKLRKAFSKLYRRHFELIGKCHVSLKN